MRESYKQSTNRVDLLNSSKNMTQNNKLDSLFLVLHSFFIWKIPLDSFHRRQVMNERIRNSISMHWNKEQNKRVSLWCRFDQCTPSNLSFAIIARLKSNCLFTELVVIFYAVALKTAARTSISLPHDAIVWTYRKTFRSKCRLSEEKQISSSIKLALAICSCMLVN